ncbi:hypothetical protein T492DRAFT_989116 [Pavlovales sp. CCMP2436]|nr:hypothetical protein T492DRAFT_989116 [Pavlovales sp. CCMP2436]|mmetsp:Transcript_6786/g.17775  ORF Transcript_6786/g.17775 Transcript_6786/m.17775 type:complete len:184 (+) Transcript_6786:37-588(+)
MPGTFLDRAGRPHSLRSAEEVSLYDGERIPLVANLTQVLKDWTKAVMVAGPQAESLVAWSAEYFGELAKQDRQDRALPSHSTGGSELALSASKAFRSLSIEMQERIEEIFSAFDADESGFINRSEFFQMIKQIGAFFAFEASQADVEELLGTVDECSDGDQQLSWLEFSAAVVSWVSHKMQLL